MQEYITYKLVTIILLTSIFTVGIMNVFRDHTVNDYLQTKCELLSNAQGTQFWYECNKSGEVK